MTLLDQAIAAKALKIALDKGHQFAEIFCEKSITNSITLEDNKLEKIRSGIDAGTGFRIVNNEITYYGYVNSLAEKEILNLAKEISAAAGIKNKNMLGELTKVVPQHQPQYKYLPETVEMTKKISYLQKANETARSFDKRIKQVSVSYADTTQKIFIANSAGKIAEDKRVRTRFITQVVAAAKGIVETGYEAPGMAQGIEMFEKELPEQIANTAARRAIVCLTAKHAPAGNMTVVLAGSAGGTLVHEACGHALEADFIHKKTSIFTDKLGKKAVSDLITVIDDGSLENYYGATAIDDEATPTKENILIDRGIVAGFMNDYLNAKLLGHELSGNGRRQSYRHVPIPRMTNTYIKAGNATYAEILASVKDGLLVKKMGGGQVDITNGNFVFEITEGYLIKNGKQDQPLRGATLVGNGIEVLKSVDMVGNDLHFIPGTCGKGQHAPVSDGQPTLRIPSIIVGGHG